MFNFNDIPTLILSLLAVLITLTLHEYAHGYAAYRLGDDTAKNSGRLTLNPIKHIDPVGALCLLVFRFGWAKPVPINPRNFKKPRRDFALSALMGPLTNILCSTVVAFFYLLFLKILSGINYTSELSYNIAYNSLRFLWIFHITNLGLGVFNLIPIPPLDGSRIFTALLPPKLYFGIMRYERRIYLVLLVWLLLGDFVKGSLLLIPFIANTPALSFLAGIFSLSDIISYIISALSDLIFMLFGLIPFLK